MAAENVGQMDPRSAGRMLVNFASLGFPPPAALAASLLERASDTRRASAVSLVEVLWAVAVLDIHRQDPAVAEKVFSQFCTLEYDPFTERDLASRN